MKIKISSFHLYVILKAIILICIILFFSCKYSTSKDFKDTKNAKADPVSVTELAALPDSLQPKNIDLPINYVNNIQKPTIFEFKDNYAGLPLAPADQGSRFYSLYNTDDGLALDDLFCIMEDQNGNLWFGTLGGGASKYDGKKFTNYTISHGLAGNTILDIFQHSSGDIWFATSGGGVSRYNGQCFTNFTINDGLANNHVWTIAEDSLHNLWFGTEGSGVSKYNGKDFTTFDTKDGLANNFIKNIIKDKSGNLWFASKSTGLSVYDGFQFKNYYIGDASKTDQITNIFSDSKGNIWLSFNGTGAFKLDTSPLNLQNSNIFHQFSKGNILRGEHILNISEDKHGNIWFGTKGNGVFQYSEKNKSSQQSAFKHFTDSDGLPNNSVFGTLEDRHQNMWIITGGGGICKFHNPKLLSFTEKQGFENSRIISIAQDKSGNILFLNGKEFIKYDSQKILKYHFPQSENQSIFSVATDRNDNIWIGGTSGLNKWETNKITKFYTKKENSFHPVNYILTDKAGGLWFSAWGDGVYYKFENSIFHYTEKQGLADNQIRCIFKDRDDNIWFGTENKGVSRFDGKSFCTYNITHGLGTNAVYSITEDIEGNIWLGTSSGLSFMSFEHKAKNNRSSKPVFKNFTTKNGLPDNFISQVISDSEGNIFLGMNSGISILRQGVHSFYKEGTINNYNRNTGFPIKNVVLGQNTIFKDKDSVLWIGTASDKSGLVRFAYIGLSQNKLIPHISIERIKVNGEPISWSSLLKIKNPNEASAQNNCLSEEVMVYGNLLNPTEVIELKKSFLGIQFSGLDNHNFLPQNLKLPHKYNNIQFEFNATESNANNLLLYQYKLDGYDKDWNPPTPLNSASFGNIYEGTYTFNVKVKSPQSDWSTPISFSFNILPPVWRTWWAYLIYVLIFMLAMYVLYLFQKQHVVQKEREKNLQLELKQAKEIETAYVKLKEAQVQLVHSEKMASLGELAAGIAHEIQNPLNFVNNFSEVSNELLVEMTEELLKGNLDFAMEIVKDVTDNLEKVKHHGKRAEAIVKGMLQHSRSSTGIKELVDINSMADEYLRLSFHGFKAKEKSFNATLDTDYDPNAGKINIVAQDIGRVILNILSNAFYAVYEKSKKHIADGGNGVYKPTVHLTTRWIKVDGHSKDKVEIAIRDNGIGIPDHVMEKIFNPFFTTKPAGQGTGLGLSLSFDIIEKGHSGVLQVKSTEGEGTEFIIQLPV
ncbi:MAG: hypothetical protein IPM42_01890 [Saprospiraceae bacterium]|nr:hypothetical protein [Saprospiraceae bacterium]